MFKFHYLLAILSTRLLEGVRLSYLSNEAMMVSIESLALTGLFLRMKMLWISTLPPNPSQAFSSGGSTCEDVPLLSVREDVASNLDVAGARLESCHLLQQAEAMSRREGPLAGVGQRQTALVTGVLLDDLGQPTPGFERPHQRRRGLDVDVGDLLALRDAKVAGLVTWLLGQLALVERHAGRHPEEDPALLAPVHVVRQAESPAESDFRRVEGARVTQASGGAHSHPGSRGSPRGCGLPRPHPHLHRLCEDGELHRGVVVGEHGVPKSPEVGPVA